jgi:hypothetical protein
VHVLCCAVLSASFSSCWPLTRLCDCAVHCTLCPVHFAGGNKCYVCNKTAYEMESLTYDKMTFHKNCFKCLSCKRTISLSAVAMIKSDLYCKTCFLRIFKEKGKYSSFGEKTLPKAEIGKAPEDNAPASPAKPVRC